MISWCKATKWWFTGLLMVLTVMLVGLPGYVSASPEKTIKIGIIGPMKLWYGVQTWWGAELAAEEINEAGGVMVNGAKHKIELVKTDDNSFLSVVDAASAMERIITVDKVDFVVGGIRSESVLAQQEVMADKKIVFISTAAGSPAVTVRVAKNYDRYKYFFRNCISGLWTTRIGLISVEMSGNKIRKEMGIEKPKIAVMAEKLKWCEPLVKVLPDVMAKLGMEYKGVWRPSAMATDVAAELEAIESTGAQILMQVFSAPVGIATSRQIGDLQIPVVPVGANIESGRWKHWKDTNGKCEYNLAEGPYARVNITEKTIPFVDKFFKRYNDMPMWVAESYDALYVLKEAIERVNSLDSDKVVEGLEKTDYVSPQGRIVFTPRDDQYPHEIVWKPGYVTWTITQWQDGKQEVVWPNGEAAFGDKGYVGVKYEGTGEYKLPPWVVDYWKKKGK